MSERLKRAETLLHRAQQTSNAEWAASHALVALGLLALEYVDRPALRQEPF